MKNTITITLATVALLTTINSSARWHEPYPSNPHTNHTSSKSKCIEPEINIETDHHSEMSGTEHSEMIGNHHPGKSKCDYSKIKDAHHSKKNTSHHESSSHHH